MSNFRSRLRKAKKALLEAAGLEPKAPTLNELWEKMFASGQGRFTDEKGETIIAQVNIRESSVLNEFRRVVNLWIYTNDRTLIVEAVQPAAEPEDITLQLFDERGNECKKVMREASTILQEGKVTIPGWDNKTITLEKAKPYSA